MVPMTRWLMATGVALVLTGNAGTSVAQERGGQGAGHWLSPSIALPPLPENAPIGGLQLDVQPWRAQVYVDGAYAGLVRDFTGYYHHIDLVAGSHLIAIVTPDYQPLIIDVIVSPGHTTTYRGALTRTPAR